VEPADYLAQAERAKLIELAGDGGDAAEALTSVVSITEPSASVGTYRSPRALVDVDPHLAMPAQRLLHLAQCLCVRVRDAECAEARTSRRISRSIASSGTPAAARIAR